MNKNVILNFDWQPTRLQVLGVKDGTGSDLLHICVEAKSSLYLSTESSLKRDFTLLMWVDRWILQRETELADYSEGSRKICPGLCERPPTHFSNLWICSSLYANSAGND